MRERALRAIDECRQIATMSEVQEDKADGSNAIGTTRRFLTAPMHRVHAHLRTRMEALEMTVHVDAVGNLRGVWQSKGARNGRFLLGSHVDTVPNAGAFDGVLGVVLALEWVELARELALPLTIEVIAFSEEEGVRYRAPFLGSRAVAGRFDPALLTLTDDEGISLEEALRTFGLDPLQIHNAILAPETFGFLEIHIEQGPVLDTEGLSVAAVTAVVGQTRLSLTFKGEANHAGTTPMRLRKDALAGAAEWIAVVESLAQTVDGLIATVGRIVVSPNAGNVVPGMAQVSLDVRHARDATRTEAVEALVDKAKAIAARRHLALERIDRLDQAAVPMDERLTSYLTDALDAAAHTAKTMPSGAGHDAMVMASRVPTAMLFLRSPGGISHHPTETVLVEDIEAALHVGRAFLTRLAAYIG